MAPRRRPARAALEESDTVRGRGVGAAAMPGPLSVLGPMGFQNIQLGDGLGLGTEIGIELVH